MVENPLSDILIRIKNGYLAGQKTVVMPHSNLGEEFVKILLNEGYLVRVEVIKDDKGSRKKTSAFKTIKMDLKYEGRKPVLTDVKIISKPSLHIYVKKSNIPYVLGGRGFVILSTSRGLMIGREARKKGLGGEVICEVW